MIGLRDLFLLRPDIVFLNHGSFGACPRPVFEAYQAWQLELERQPVEFLGRHAGLDVFHQHVESSRRELSGLEHASERFRAVQGNFAVARTGSGDVEIGHFGIKYSKGFGRRRCRRFLSLPVGKITLPDRTHQIRKWQLRRNV